MDFKQSKKRLEGIVDNSWLNLPDDFVDSIVSHPFSERSQYDIEYPHIHLLKLMRQPDNFSFTCKKILNIDILPFQAVILKELWIRKYPMLIGSRGLGKCITGDSLLMTDTGIKRIQEVGADERVLGEDGYQPVAYSWCNGETWNSKITTRQGFEIEGTLDHPIRVVEDGGIIWKELKDVREGQYVVIDRTDSWFEKTNDVPPDLGYFFGLLVGDGGYTVRGRISYTTADDCLAKKISEISKKYWDKDFIKNNHDKYGYNLYGVAIWDELFNKYGFNSSVCGEKDFPKSILHSSKETVKQFIRGLMDTDGSCNKKGDIVHFCSKSKALCKTLQFVLTRFGIISKYTSRLNTKYNTYYHYVYIMGDDLKLYTEKIGFGLQRKQNRANQCFVVSSNPNLDILPHTLILKSLLALKKKYHSVVHHSGHGYSYDKSLISPYRLKTYQPSFSKLKKILSITEDFSTEPEWQYLHEISQKPYFYDKVVKKEDTQNLTYDVHIPNGHSFVSNGFISHNTFLLAVYTLLRALLSQGSKIVLVGAAFRQSKLIFDAAENIWANAPVLQSMVDRTDKTQQPRRDTDRCYMKLGSSTIVAIPIGTGEKIRGLRACVGPNTLIETDRGLIRIKDFSRYMGDASVYTGDGGNLENPKYFLQTQPIDAYKVTTLWNFSFICSDIHQVYTTNGWKLAKDLQPKVDELVFQNNYNFPENYVEIDNLVVNEKLAWFLGILVSEGAVSSRGALSVKMNDQAMINKIGEVAKEIDASLSPCYYVRPAKVDRRGWNCQTSYDVQICNLKFRKKLLACGLERRIAPFKIIPETILRSPKSVVLSFLSGLFEGDGTAFLYKDKVRSDNLGVAYYSSSEQLIDELQVLLAKLDIFATKGSRVSKISSRLQYHLRLYGRAAYQLIDMLNVDKWQEVVTKARRDSKFMQSRKSLKVKTVEKLDGQHILYDFTMAESHSFMGNCFINHNTHLLCDEFSSVPEQIYEEVISGFAAVASNPVQKIKDGARKQKLLELGLITPEDIITDDFGNQSVIAGTAGYGFEYFAKYWKRYKDIILSHGDEQKLLEIFDGNIPDGFDWRSFSIIRIPYDMLPPYFLDMEHIGRSKATVNSVIFLKEYGACHGPDTPIITNYGTKKITDVKIGDLVLTHTGKFKKVLHCLSRYYSGTIIKWKSFGYNQYTYTTPEHPFYTGEGWLPLDDLGGFTFLSNLRELSSLTNIDLRDYCTNYTLYDNKMTARHGGTKVTNEQKHEIIQAEGCLREIAEKYHLSITAVHFIRKQAQPKFGIPLEIKLDYDFGLIIGYYAAEGSGGSSGRALGFALDGHVNGTLEKYVSQLDEAIYKVFGLQARHYTKDAVTNVSINNRLVVEIVKNICPNTSHFKYVQPEILFSNPEFMKGFIIGYWNGDGHIMQHKVAVVSSSVSHKLSEQVRMCLSYFGISASINKKINKSSLAPKGTTLYEVVAHGENGKKFRELFYDSMGVKGETKSQYMSNDGVVGKFGITEKTTEDYNGYVYNLSVEEDNSYSLLNATVHNCFPSDSDGFFRRSLIESCVTKDGIELKSGFVRFAASIRGQVGYRYVYAIDPASEKDNFSIVVLELHDDHRRIVYSWTTTRNKHKDKVKQGFSKEDDFYGYCGRKIRNLMKIFPCERIAIDSQGGGYALLEVLHDRVRLREGEQPLWEVINPEDPKDTDTNHGKHIIEIINFAKAEWVSEANHGMRKDFEDKVLLFPYFDAVALATAVKQDLDENREYDTLEDCVMEIEELKDELAMIVQTRTGVSNREHWGVPDIKAPGTRKGRLRKDRYSALLMANMIARVMQKPVDNKFEYQYHGGFAGAVREKPKDAENYMYYGLVPEEMRAATAYYGNYGGCIRRNS